MYYPQKVSSDGEFWCGGHQFVMKKLELEVRANERVCF